MEQGRSTQIMQMISDSDQKVHLDEVDSDQEVVYEKLSLPNDNLRVNVGEVQSAFFRGRLLPARARHPNLRGNGA